MELREANATVPRSYPYRCCCGGPIALVGYVVTSTHVLAEGEHDRQGRLAYIYDPDAWYAQGTHRETTQERFHCCVCGQDYSRDEVTALCGTEPDISELR